jgi:anti-sigma B factor antagonist
VLSIQGQRQDERCKLALAGELDMASAHELVGRAQELCAQGASQLVVDLTQLEFIDSAGLNAILGVRTVCSEHSCELRLTPAKRPVQRLFEVTRLIDKLPFDEPRGAGSQVAPPQASRSDADAAR